MLIIIASIIGASRNGTIKLIAMKNFAKNVTIVAVQMCFSFLFLSASSEKCTPIASDSASAIAITTIPLITASNECVPAFSPTIRPSVVTTPDASPKLNPFFIANFTMLSLRIYI